MRRSEEQKDWNCRPVFWRAPRRRHRLLSRSKESDSARPSNWKSIFCTDRKRDFISIKKQNYQIVAQHALGQRVLDCFTNQGGFALACALAGAADVTAVEASAENLRGAQRITRSAMSVNVRWIEGRMSFNSCAARKSRSAQFDLIVLDPPSFTKGKGGLRDALRGYQANCMCARSSCFRRMDSWPRFPVRIMSRDEVFAGMIRDALVDARRSAR